MVNLCQSYVFFVCFFLMERRYFGHISYFICLCSANLSKGFCFKRPALPEELEFALRDLPARALVRPGLCVFPQS